MIWKDQDGFLDKIKDESRYGIFLDMGVGKTSLLLALADYKFFCGVKKVLIITPKKVSLSTWQNEIDKWDNFRYMKDYLELLDGSVSHRNSCLTTVGGCAIHIISSSLTEWLYGSYSRKGSRKVFEKNHLTPDYDMIIVDECSQFKSPKSKRFKALKKLSENKMLFLLSGTPFSNMKKERGHYTNADELYYILNLLKLFDGTLTNYREKFCFTQPWNTYNWLIDENIFEMITDIIRGKSITKKLSLDVAMNEHLVFCERDEKRFKQLKNEFYIETNGLTEITASNQAIMINKALQLSNGFAYDNGNKVVRFNEYKFEKLKEVLEVEKSNAIIFYNFKEDKLFLLSKIKGARTIETKSDIDDWNNGKIKVLILSPFSEKYGLNLQQGGNTIIWYGLVWSAESYSQANARLYRRGQTKDVNVYYLLAEKTYDFYVYQVLIKKTKTINDFISYENMI